MQRRLLISLGCGAVFLLTPLLLAGTGAAPAAGPSRAALLAQGKYIVDRVGMCSDCHPPHLSNGKWDMRRYLQGAPIEFKPIRPVPNWASRAPNINANGLKEDSAAQITTWLRGKSDAQGQPIPIFRPPMPPLRMNANDARAVATYLKSVR